MEAVKADGDWTTRAVTTGAPVDTYKARELLHLIAEGTSICGDPGVQYDTTVNKWHTCPKSGRINASNPCSEYMFLDDTACNLASLNLVTFLSDDGLVDIEMFRHAVRLWTMVLEISVLMASFPSRRIAELSYRYRTLGLGYANIGSLLMRMGIPYDSDEGRSICGAITAIMTGESYATSAEMARELGPFPGYEENREHMLRVIGNHRRAEKLLLEACLERLPAGPMLWTSVYSQRQASGSDDMHATAKAMQTALQRVLHALSSDLAASAE